MRTKHRQQKIMKGTHVQVEVDEGIVSFLQAVWGLGFDTQFSCQGGDYVIQHPTGRSGWVDSTQPRRRFGPMLGYVLLMGEHSARALSELLEVDYVEVSSDFADHWRDPKHPYWSRDVYIEDDPTMEWGRSAMRFQNRMLPEMTERAENLIKGAKR